MFRRLRLQFIMITSLAILFILIFTVGIINTVRSFQTEQEISKVLNTLTENNGSFGKIKKIETNQGREIPSDSFRFFSLTLSDDKVVSQDTSHTSLINDEEAARYALTVSRLTNNLGTIREKNINLSYQVSKVSKDKILVVFLDTSSYYNSSQALFSLSILLSLFAFIFFVVIVSALSGIVIRPFIRNYEKQRRFITNAGHELKTPLAIISANTELQELMTGENEWTKSTNDQVARLTNLVNSLVALSRLEEQPDMVLQDVDFSYITEDAAEDFKGPVVRDGKSFVMDIAPDIHVKAEEKSLFELVTLLVDNANNYCDPEGSVTVRLRQIGRTRKRARLEVSNTYKEGKEVDYSKFFERFYRIDESRNNKEHSGFGIGLSMAQSMVKLFKGRIFTSYKNDTITFTVIL
ncbi:sensor histidine kinase [Streptococcus vestibularis]|jgi:two-component system sensor histidine kinase CiaH|uniref:histidine kinase n=1 Tax=Streptococcus vestibularis TaxID=1343 RepID=A0AAW7QE92_STRVE|nr:HAMP domain-containing sensor histidine kinase [Streptococcus vestibularis]MDN5268826.1 HAMP domain-containing sensor histidine kinase [Streptococcus vestibularis]